MATEKKNVKNNVLPHSKAKLKLYEDYLSEYLPILGHSPFVDGVNLFDVFCGAGIYEDGNHGSPMIAASQICNYIASFTSQGKATKPIRLIINDFDSAKVQGVQEMVSNLQLKNCSVVPYNLDADEMFAEVSKKINSFPQRERNLVFVDPYGYSKIKKQNLFNILNGNRSEVIMFLPVAQMYRFTGKAQNDYETKCYEHLRTFTHEFFEGNHKALSSQFSDVFDYINELTNAFSFGNRFYTSSHYIQRDNSNYFAVFFIGHHIYGLEKFLEVKWKNDSLGKGFNLASGSMSLFENFDDYDRSLSEQRLETLLREFLKNRAATSNIDLYEFTLKSQFLITHCKYPVKRVNFFLI